MPFFVVICSFIASNCYCYNDINNLLLFVIYLYYYYWLYDVTSICILFINLPLFKSLVYLLYVSHKFALMLIFISLLNGMIVKTKKINITDGEFG